MPVWENKPYNRKLHNFLIKEAEKNYKNALKFTMPVTYDASKYSSTDGVQAVSEISSRLVFHPEAHILFLTSTRYLEWLHLWNFEVR